MGRQDSRLRHSATDLSIAQYGLSCHFMFAKDVCFFCDGWLIYFFVLLALTEIAEMLKIVADEYFWRW